MGPVRQNTNPENCKNCSSKCAYDCAQLATSVHNTTQNSSDNLPSYPQTSIIAQMLSIGGEGWPKVDAVNSAQQLAMRPENGEHIGVVDWRQWL